MEKGNEILIKIVYFIRLRSLKGWRREMKVLKSLSISFFFSNGGRILFLPFLFS